MLAVLTFGKTLNKLKFITFFDDLNKIYQMCSGFGWPQGTKLSNVLRDVMMRTFCECCVEMLCLGRSGDALGTLCGLSGDI